MNQQGSIHTKMRTLIQFTTLIANIIAKLFCKYSQNPNPKLREKRKIVLNKAIGK